MFKGVLSKDKIVLVLLTLILLGLVSLIFFRFQLTSAGLVSAQQFYFGIQKSFNPSLASFTLDKTDLKIRFKIVSSDKDAFKSFIKNLGLNNVEEAEINIKLGNETAEFLNTMMQRNHLAVGEPVNLNLRILSKEIDFDNKKIFGPFDSTSEYLLESPSGLGSIKTDVLGENSYSIEIDNPAKAMAEGTLSGKLKLSDKLIDSGWWQVLTKLAKINLKIEDGALTGAIFLK